MQRELHVERHLRPRCDLLRPRDVCVQQVRNSPRS